METTKRRRTRKTNSVVSLRGAAIPVPQVNGAVVAKLDELRDRALAGHAVGLAFAIVSPQGHISTGWDGNADAHLMIAAVTVLQNRIVRAGTSEE